ncbi:flagella cluster protein [Halobacteria archaeon AArc-dxtr1]|nr:flagella cluster protein [Halobacteria archaeon AArc-dxtr1]
MTRLDLSDGFSFHDYRANLKLLKGSDGTHILANRADLRCPSCDRPFDRLFVTEQESHTFDTPPDGSFCVARTDEKLLVLTHYSSS